ncbi:hypothetical protein N7454_005943 [Penicillium verhagenii]|nr:hypothetical protein N7454_005943 [Penicillium verhagenii]
MTVKYCQRSNIRRQGRIDIQNIQRQFEYGVCAKLETAQGPPVEGRRQNAWTMSIKNTDPALVHWSTESHVVQKPKNTTQNMLHPGEICVHDPKTLLNPQNRKEEQSARGSLIR